MRTSFYFPCLEQGATKNNPHLLKIARLEYEYAQRQNLTEKCVQLEKEQERISAEILKRQTELGSIEPILEKILEVSKLNFNQILIVRRMQLLQCAYSYRPSSLWKKCFKLT